MSTRRTPADVNHRAYWEADRLRVRCGVQSQILDDLIALWEHPPGSGVELERRLGEIVRRAREAQGRFQKARTEGAQP